MKRQILDSLARFRAPKIRLGVAPSSNREIISTRASAHIITHIFNEEHYLAELRRIGKDLSGLMAQEHYERFGDHWRICPNFIFDVQYYHEIYPDVARAGMSALSHYTTYGHLEDRNPHPLFDTRFVRAQTRSAKDPLATYLEASPGSLQPHPDFDELFVLKQLGEQRRPGETALTAFLRMGPSIDPSAEFHSNDYSSFYADIKTMNPFYHYIRWGRGEGRGSGPNLQAVRRVMDEIEFAANLDPDIVPSNTDMNSLPKIVRLSQASPHADLMQRLIARILPSKNTIIYIINDLVTGGAERVLANLAASHRTDTQVQQIVVLATGGEADEARVWLTDTDAVVVNIARDVSSIGQIYEAASLIATFLQLITVRDVCVINSALGWAMVEMHGHALRSRMRLFACAFCYDYDRFGRRSGYAWTDLAGAWKNLDGVITDNVCFAVQLKHDLHLSDDDFTKIKVLYQPVQKFSSPAQAAIRAANSSPLTVLWAGRFARQKRVDLALKIADQMPHVQFLFAGGTLQDVDKPPMLLPSNVTFLGRFNDFSELPYRDCSAFLYTSAWDGLPNILLEAASVRLPIVAPAIGGIPELIDDKTGWLVVEHDSSDAYVVQLQNLLDQPKLSRQRSERLLDLIERRHDCALFQSEVATLFADRSEQVMLR